MAALGLSYARNEDYGQAAHWFKKAAANGNIGATVWVDRIAKRQADSMMDQVKGFWKEWKSDRVIDLCTRISARGG
jgi:TPR repeat protein